MAINFLDGITVNSGTSSAATIVAVGTRPITLTGGAIGSVAIGGSNGGWATGYFFTGYSGTNRGGFGALGSVDALSYYYIGDAYNDTTMVVQPNAGNVGIGTTSPTQKLTVNGVIKIDTSSDKQMQFARTGGNTFSLEHDSARMYFYNETSANTPLTLLNSGNVGIGTTAPTEKLEVAGKIKITGTANFIDTTRNASSQANYIRFYDSSTSAVEAYVGFTSNNRDFKIESANGGGTLTLKAGGATAMHITSTGNVGIGTTSPSDGDLTIGTPKLHVAVGGTSGTFNLAARFQSTTSDADNTGTSILINSSNDRGLLIKAGRKDGDREVAYFDAVSSTGNTTNMLTMGKFSSAYNVGIGTTSPSDKLHVSSGMIRVEGVGCGIRMPDTSGNPLLALTTDQNSFAGCNIVNGWGNSSNTGVGVGTTRSDGTAFQVRTGITLSSGIATSSGTQRLIVYGSGGTKITSSLGVGTANPSTTTGRIDASNDIVAYSTSDIRLKDNIKSIDKALDKVNKIQGIEFDWIEKEEVHDNSGHDVGVIAQEIEKVLPDVVTTRENGYKAVKYEKIVPLLIEAIKDLSKQVDGLKRLI